MDLNAENSYGEANPEISHTTFLPSPARHSHRAPGVSALCDWGPDQGLLGSNCWPGWQRPSQRGRRMQRTHRFVQAAGAASFSPQNAFP